MKFKGIMKNEKKFDKIKNFTSKLTFTLYVVFSYYMLDTSNWVVVMNNLIILPAIIALFVSVIFDIIYFIYLLKTRSWQLLPYLLYYKRVAYHPFSSIKKFYRHNNIIFSSDWYLMHTNILFYENKRLKLYNNFKSI